MREHAVSQHIRLDAGEINVELWRNNCGAFRDDTGRVIRYGLCNESKKMSEEIKSSDLIGITPTLITPQMVGYYLGVFTAIETKAINWAFSKYDARTIAQSKFHDIVRKAGGYAGFARTVEEFRRIIGR